MLKNIKKILYRRRLALLFKKGLEEKKIIPFSESDYEQMNNTYIGGVPMSFYIKYFKPTRPPGECYDRSLGMFFCFPNAILVRADTKNLEIEYDDESAGHGWIEVDNYVYDPSLLMKMEKDLYYQIYQPYNIYKIDKDEYLQVPSNRELYESITKTKIEDYQPHGKKRYELLTNIPILIGLESKIGNESFSEELNTYLKKIKYDEEEIHQEIKELLDSKIKKRKVG